MFLSSQASDRANERPTDGPTCTTTSEIDVQEVTRLRQEQSVFRISKISLLFFGKNLRRLSKIPLSCFKLNASGVSCRKLLGFFVWRLFRCLSAWMAGWLASCFMVDDWLSLRCFASPDSFPWRSGRVRRKSFPPWRVLPRRVSEAKSRTFRNRIIRQPDRLQGNFFFPRE